MHIFLTLTYKRLYNIPCYKHSSCSIDSDKLDSRSKSTGTPYPVSMVTMDTRIPYSAWNSWGCGGGVFCREMLCLTFREEIDGVWNKTLHVFSHEKIYSISITNFRLLIIHFKPGKTKLCMMLLLWMLKTEQSCTYDTLSLCSNLHYFLTSVMHFSLSSRWKA